MNLPNKITIARIILTVVFAVLALVPMTNGLLYAAAVFAIAAVSDFVDGHLARRHNLISNFGKFMDPLADKILVISALLILVSLGRFPVWAAIIIVCRDFAVDGLRFVAAEKGVVIAASRWGKWKTMTQMITVVLLLVMDLFPFVWYTVLCQIAIVLAVVLTVVSGAIYLYNGREFFR